MQPERIQRKRTKGWRMPENTVYVGRPSKWGNPVEAKKIELPGGDILEITKEDAARWYQWVVGRNEAFVSKIKTHLKGKNLACWCRPDEPCHADVLLKIANNDV